MLTERRTTESAKGSSSGARFIRLEVDRKVGILGLDAA